MPDQLTQMQNLFEKHQSLRGEYTAQMAKSVQLIDDLQKDHLELRKRHVELTRQSEEVSKRKLALLKKLQEMNEEIKNLKQNQRDIASQK